ncbi:MAG: copper resistance protein CopZ [Betaproteobacteria bacterium RIFCSPLOWO2_12_FULL_65_14]|nr:MAG: copper resistance protein CopZ [Betaproteobacteria bacterium RIFCSPLOWO2_12_FULL_65_14]
MTTTVQFEVLGEEKIHCAGCESRIAAALGRVPGVEDVQASAETQRVKVAFDAARASEEEIRARLEKLGYQVRRQ